MYGKIIISLIVILIMILVVYLFGTKGTLKKLKEIVGKGRKVICHQTELQVTGGPVIYVRPKGVKNYQKIKIREKEFPIGRLQNNKLVLNSPEVEKKHAVIRKVVKGDHVYFEFVNYARTNPTEYYNKRKDGYDTLRYKEGVELDAREAFFVGDVKIIITIPGLCHRPTETERVKVKNKDSGRKAGTETRSQRMKMPGMAELEF